MSGRRTLSLSAFAVMTACGGSNMGPGSTTGSTFTATIDGTAFSSVATVALRTPALPGLPNGTLGVSGPSKFTLPYSLLVITVPAAIGTYPLASSDPIPQNASLQNLISTTSGAQWNAGAGFGGTGSITLSTLTASTASGVFSFTLVPLPGSGATGNKMVANGKFNVKF